MSTTPIPTPAAYLYTTPSGARVVDLKRVDLDTPGLTVSDLIAVEQAEAYADARVAESQQWQPIETAPQGQIALFYDAKATEVRNCMFVDWAVDGKFYGDRQRTATHWMPLPDPPQQ